MPNPAHHFRPETLGFRLCRDAVAPMPRAHIHSEVELNRVQRGTVTYRFGDRHLTMHPGTLYVFSGLAPHELIEVSDQAVLDWLTVPLTWFCRWPLHGYMTRVILDGHILEDRDPVQYQRDDERFAHWEQDLQTCDPRVMQIALLEVRARLERIALSPTMAEHRPLANTTQKRKRLQTLANMMRYMLAHLGEKITIADIAGSANVHPGYAATLFRQQLNQTPIGFLNQQRLSYAKWLLLSTDMQIIDVALHSGFGALSHFYDAFQRDTGQAPGAYRKQNV